MDIKWEGVFKVFKTVNSLILLCLGAFRHGKFYSLLYKIDLLEFTWINILDKGLKRRPVRQKVMLLFVTFGPQKVGGSLY